MHLEYWIGVKDGLLRQYTSEGQLTTAGGPLGTLNVSCIAAFSDYGKPVEIQRPRLQTPEPMSELLDPACFDSATYSVHKPTGEDWSAQAHVESDVVQFENQVGPKVEGMVFVNTLLGGLGDLPLPSSQIAEDFLDSEHDIMITRGVNAGLYELEYARKGTTTVGEKHFYFMEFLQVFDEEVAALPFSVDGVLYLYFPPDFAQQKRFYGILFKEFYVQGEPRVELTAEQKQAVLGSLRLK
jgi:hypothetical protein